MKKYLILLFLIICLCSFSLINAALNSNNFNLLGRVIYLDPGHGGVDPGTTYKDVYEKDINLSICLYLQKALEKEGAIVYLTRTGDYDLSNINAYGRKKSDLNNRVKIINSSKADIYISIHLNSISSSFWNGAQVFYDDINKKNYQLATLLQKQLKKDLKTNREVKEIKNMLMNRKITIPGVLLEVGFLSNPNERFLLQKDFYQIKISESIVKGIIKYFK